MTHYSTARHTLIARYNSLEVDRNVYAYGDALIERDLRGQIQAIQRLSYHGVTMDHLVMLTECSSDMLAQLINLPALSIEARPPVGIPTPEPIVMHHMGDGMHSPCGREPASAYWTSGHGYSTSWEDVTCTECHERRALTGRR